MIFSLRTLVVGIVLGVTAIPASAAEKDIFDFAAQKAAPKTMKKIVFVADTAPHGGRGNHEFLAAAILLARTINADYPESAYWRSTPRAIGPRICRTPMRSSSF